jgi:peptidoglycan/LPS O-acetylase OafA/YrhL
MIYVKQLDTIRAFAILSVVTTHWSSSNSIYYKISATISAPFIFFTLSGFLITRILFSERLYAEQFALKKSKVFKNFFI